MEALSRHDGSMNALSVHQLTPNDIASRAAIVTEKKGTLSYEGDALPPGYRELFGEDVTYLSLLTCGDGACGAHAVFGRPRAGSFKCDVGIRCSIAAYFENT